MEIFLELRARLDLNQLLLTRLPLSQTHHVAEHLVQEFRRLVDRQQGGTQQQPQRSSNIAQQRYEGIGRTHCDLAVHQCRVVDLNDDNVAGLIHNADVGRLEQGLLVDLREGGLSEVVGVGVAKALRGTLAGTMVSR